jgi:glycosyltransferase involved in cell wall biosynthesis
MPFNRFYYRIKPYLPWRFRNVLRRLAAQVTRRANRETWPISEAAGDPPPDWPGWPDGKRFALILTHDVEGPEGLAKCRDLMRLEKELGFCSSFNFIPEGSYEAPSDLRAEMDREGFEVGVHDLNHDGKLYRNRREFADKAARINGYLDQWGAVGFRGGFMLRNLDWLHDVRMLYDSSTFDTDPFEPQPQGMHTIFPFWAPPPPGSASTGYIELPYTLPQDSTLFLVLREKSPAIWLRKLDWIFEHGGMALVNVHPDYIAFGAGKNGPRTFPVEWYADFLVKARERYDGAFCAVRPRDLARFLWDRRASLASRVAPAVRKRPRRICVIRHGYFPSDARVRKEVEALVDAGHEANVFCLRQDRGQPLQEKRKRLEILRLPFRHHRESALQYIMEYAASILLFTGLFLLRHFRRHYDIVQVNTMPDALYLCTVIPKLLGCRVVIDFHEPTPELWVTKYGNRSRIFLLLQKNILKRAIWHADQSLTVTMALKQKLEEFSGHPGIVVCPNVTSLSFGRNVKTCQMYDDGLFVLVTHGLIEERYGHQLVIDAVCRLASQIPGLCYEIIGTGEYREALEKYVAEKNAGSLVTFRGFLKFDELVNRLRGANVGIIPMRRSPYSELIDTNKMYEYMALGIPVIHSRLPVVESVFNETSIEFFAPDDSEDLQRAIFHLYNSPDRRTQIAKEATRITSRIAWENVKTHYVNAVVGSE